MPSGGHNKKPTAIKVIEGTLKGERVVAHEFTPTKLNKPPAPPPHYSELAKSRWTQIASEMCEAGILHNVDVQLLEDYCDAYECCLLYKAAIKEHGAMILSDKGHLYANPAASRMVLYEKLMLSIGANLGLGAANRTKIGGAKPKEKAGLKELLAKKPA